MSRTATLRFAMPTVAIPTVRSTGPVRGHAVGRPAWSTVTAPRGGRPRRRAKGRRRCARPRPASAPVRQLRGPASARRSLRVGRAATRRARPLSSPVRDQRQAPPARQ